MKVVLAAVLLASGCGEQTTTRIVTAPSAASRYEDIREAVDRLNEEVGEEVFTLGVASGEGPVDGYAVVRVVDQLAGEEQTGSTWRDSKGVVIRILPTTSTVQIAHEFGHAAGLKHVPYRVNLMFARARNWRLTDEQRRALIAQTEH